MWFVANAEPSFVNVRHKPATYIIANSGSGTNADKLGKVEVEYYCQFRGLKLEGLDAD